MDALRVSIGARPTLIPARLVVQTWLLEELCRGRLLSERTLSLRTV